MTMPLQTKRFSRTLRKPLDSANADITDSAGTGNFHRESLITGVHVITFYVVGCESYGQKMSAIRTKARRLFESSTFGLF